MGKDPTNRMPSNGRKVGIVIPLAFALVTMSGLETGCSNLNRNTSTNNADPLLGGPGLKPTSAAAAPQASTPVAVLPTPAPSNGTPSTAVLAAATPLPMDSSRDLRIGNPASSPGSDAWAGQGITTAGGSSGAVLQHPQVVVEPASRSDPVPPATIASLPGGTGINSIEQAESQLTSRGVVYEQWTFVKESGQGEFKCSLPNKQNPRLRRTYVGKGPDYLTAVRAVLEQIDKDQ